MWMVLSDLKSLPSLILIGFICSSSYSVEKCYEDILNITFNDIFECHVKNYEFRSVRVRIYNISHFHLLPKKQTPTIYLSLIRQFFKYIIQYVGPTCSLYKSNNEF